MLSSACILGFSYGKFAEGGRHSFVQLESADTVLLMDRASRKRRSRFRVEGPLAPYFEPYSESLADRGYSQVSYWKKTFLISEFSRWLGKKRIAADAIIAEHKEAFLRYSARCRTPKGGQRGALDGITGWLQDKGVIDSSVAASTRPSGIEAILQEYAAWSREERGLAPSTVENYSGYVRRFLSSICSTEELRLAGIKASQITDYIRRNAPRDRTFSQAKNIVSALRSFLRFARYRDYIQTDLAAVVPASPDGRWHRFRERCRPIAFAGF